MNVINDVEIKNIITNTIRSKTMFLTLEDGSYNLLDRSWYDKKPFLGCKILPYTETAFDCGKRAIDLTCYMHDRYRKKYLGFISEDSPGTGGYPALPFGILKYHDYKLNEWHIINFAICGPSVENAEIVFYERGRNTWKSIDLYPDEKDTIKYMMIF